MSRPEHNSQATGLSENGATQRLVTTHPDEPTIDPDADVKEQAATNVDDHVKYKKRLVKSSSENKAWKKKLWLAGHFAVIVFGGISISFQVFWIPNRYYINSISYRLALLGAISALFATSSHKFGIHNLPPTSTLLAQQNFQYFILAVLWIFTYKSTFKLLPYLLISLLQLATSENLKFVLAEQDLLAAIIAYDELILIVVLLLRTLFFRSSSGYQLVLYLSFYWLRILFNKETKNLFKAVLQRLDGKVSKVKNPKVQYGWSKVMQIVEDKSIDEEE